MFPQHIPPLVPLIPWDQLSGHFLSVCYCTCRASPTSGPAVSHGWVNCYWPGGLSQHKVSSVRCSTLEEPLAAGMWQGELFSPCFCFHFRLSVCVSVCMCSRGRLAGGATGGLLVFSQMHEKTGPVNLGWQLRAGRRRRRTAALCAGAVDRRFMFLCSLLLKVSLLHVALRGIDSELRRGRLPGWICSWSRLNHRTLMSSLGLTHFHSERTSRNPPCAPSCTGCWSECEYCIAIINLSLSLNCNQERKIRFVSWKQWGDHVWLVFSVKLYSCKLCSVRPGSECCGSEFAICCHGEVKTWAWPWNVGRLGICLFLCPFTPAYNKHLENTSCMPGIAWMVERGYKKRFYKNIKVGRTLSV